MNSNKSRLYVALYARAGAPTMLGAKRRRYHLGLLTGPKREAEGGRGMRYHVKDLFITPGQKQWTYEERDIPLVATNMLLVRVVVAKVTDRQRLEKVLRRVPIVQGDQTRNCVIWVKNGLETLQADGKALGTSQLDWNTVRDAAMKYCQDKKDQHRFDSSDGYDMSDASTYGLLERREVTA